MDEADTPVDDDSRSRRPAAVVTGRLHELGLCLALLAHHAGAGLGLADGDLACLAVIARDGPLTPTALARRTGRHPATLTGVVDRLVRTGWATRERDPADRRAVLLRTPSDRMAALHGLVAPLIAAVENVCADQDSATLARVADVLTEITRAAHRMAGQ